MTSMAAAPPPTSSPVRDSDMHKAYVFLCFQSVETLKDICKFWNIGEHFKGTVSGKPILIAQIMCFMHTTCIVKHLSTVTEILEGKEWEYPQFLKRWVVVFSDHPLPCMTALHDIATMSSAEAVERVKRFPELLTRAKKTLTQRSKRKGASPAKGSGTPSKRNKTSKSTAINLTGDDAVLGRETGNKVKRMPFTLSEFTRLMVLIRDDPECRRAFLNASRTITKRSDMDKKIKPTDNWVDVIEKRYNDVCLRPRHAVEHLFDEPIAPEDPPSCYRPGAYLRAVWNGFRTLSSLPIANYKRSGQNNPNFKEFMDAEKGRKSYKLSERDRKRVIIGAVVFGLGTPREDEELLRCSGRSIDYSGSVGHEGGAGEFDSVAGGSRSATWSRSQSRKRSSGEFHDASMKFFESASSYFKLEEEGNEAEKVRSRSKADAEQSTSAVTHIGNRRKLLEELAFAEARLQEGMHKDRWEKQIVMITRALGNIDKNDS